MSFCFFSSVSEKFPFVLPRYLFCGFISKKKMMATMLMMVVMIMKIIINTNTNDVTFKKRITKLYTMENLSLQKERLGNKSLQTRWQDSVRTVSDRWRTELCLQTCTTRRRWGNTWPQEVVREFGTNGGQVVENFWQVWGGNWSFLPFIGERGFMRHFEDWGFKYEAFIYPTYERVYEVK